ncbi:MAG: metallophosphoesterase family protein [Anaerolineae bacterium]|nr:metallophosphoesterase family protein [Anaerolineae bacterium]
MDDRPVGPPDYRPNALHQAIVAVDLLSRIPPALISPALAGMAAIAAWPWREPALQVAAGLATLLAILVDGVSLSLLPHRGRSYGPPTPPLLALALLRSGIVFVLGALWPTWVAVALALLVHLALTIAQLYATWVEPFRLAVTHVDLPTRQVDAPRPLRILHVSDVHFEGWTPRERELLARARELAPDLILMTGDYLNLSSVHDPDAQQEVRALLADLAAIAPTYAITGSPPVDRSEVVPAIFDGLPITWLMDEWVDRTVAGHRLRLVGLRSSQKRQRDVPRLLHLLADGETEDFTILLYHSPDLMPEAVACGVDLYLAGHTHGGQLSLPFFGALVTSSEFGKRYESGLYREGDTVLYVSRGLGMEGLGAPRARFFAPPELILFTLTAAADPPGRS